MAVKMGVFGEEFRLGQSGVRADQAIKGIFGPNVLVRNFNYSIKTIIFDFESNAPTEVGQNVGRTDQEDAAFKKERELELHSWGDEKRVLLEALLGGFAQLMNQARIEPSHNMRVEVKVLSQRKTQELGISVRISSSGSHANRFRSGKWLSFLGRSTSEMVSDVSLRMISRGTPVSMT
jgi:hypothetical protein